VKGRGLKNSRKSIFVGGTSTLERREGEKLLYYPPKTIHWKLEHQVLESEDLVFEI
jgi:hypothetical protein